MGNSPPIDPLECPHYVNVDIGPACRGAPAGVA